MLRKSHALAKGTDYRYLLHYVYISTVRKQSFKTFIRQISFLPIVTLSALVNYIQRWC